MDSGSDPGHDNPDPVELVRLACTRYRFEGHRANDVRQRYGLNLTQFYQLVNAAIDDPSVAFAAPAETARLRRLRDGQQRQRRAG